MRGQPKPEQNKKAPEPCVQGLRRFRRRQMMTVDPFSRALTEFSLISHGVWF